MLLIYENENEGPTAVAQALWSPREKTMDVEKLRNLTDAELLHQQQELNDQLFRLKFQLKMGQTESVTKIRGLRKDVARIHTVMREKQLGIAGPSNGQPSEAGAPAAAPKKAAAKPAAARKKPVAAKSAKAKLVGGEEAISTQ